MSNVNDTEIRQGISDFLTKRKARRSVKVTEVSTPSIEPWYKRPLDKSEFSYKLAKNGRYYVRHKEWGNTVWVGPYTTIDAAERIIESYVVESLKDTLDKKADSSIHSVIIDNPEEFF
jgi:hypothetical protein